MITLYEYAGSPNCARVRLALEECHASFAAVQVDLDHDQASSAAFLAINPAGRVPALVEGKLRIFESNAILLHLAERFPKGKLLPASGQRRAEALSWFFWAVTSFNEMSWTLYLELAFKEPGERNVDLVKLCRAELRHLLGVLEKQLASRAFIAGATLTVADLSALPGADLLEACRISLATFPSVAAWRGRMHERESWKRTEAAYR